MRYLTLRMEAGLEDSSTAVLYAGFFLVGAFADGVAGSTLTALVLPVLAYVMFYLARRGIANDIELVRSMDRLRG